MPSGKIKWFNSKKGYGFITEDKTERDIFLHVSSLEKSRLRIGPSTLTPPIGFGLSKTYKGISLSEHDSIILVNVLT